MSNERFELVYPENLQEKCETKWQCCFICQKDEKRVYVFNYQQKIVNVLESISQRV